MPHGKAASHLPSPATTPRPIWTTAWRPCSRGATTSRSSWWTTAPPKTTPPPSATAMQEAVPGHRPGHPPGERRPRRGRQPGHPATPRGMYYKVVDSDDWLDVRRPGQGLDKLRAVRPGRHSRWTYGIANYVYEHVEDNTQKADGLPQRVPHRAGLHAGTRSAVSGPPSIC